MAGGLREVGGAAGSGRARARSADASERTQAPAEQATPIGVVVIIDESRPNATADAASLCFETGNATILRGGKEALNSNRLIAEILVEAGRAVLGDRFPAHAIQVVPIADREAIPALLSLTRYVDFACPVAAKG
jgi:glutamate-5-semialdehyde dehydrogenase